MKDATITNAARRMKPNWNGSSGIAEFPPLELGVEETVKLEAVVELEDLVEGVEVVVDNDVVPASEEDISE